MTNLHNMNSEKIRINETHICVLRKKENQDELYVDFFELKFPYQTQLEELKILSENPNRCVLELVDFVKNSNLSVLMKSFDFCESLSSPWQYCPNISEIKSEDYRKCISEYNQKIKEAKDENEREIENNRKQNFINSKRTNFYAKIEKHVLPYLLECTYNKLEGNKSVLAFSHRRIGWSKPEFRLSNELSVIYKTNFGYGASSYFFTNIKYKGIDILPYSDWIRYYHANKAEIIRYTRRHLLKNEEWIKTMDFTAEMYNSSIMEPDVFIENWIINEVDEMVKGLERLLNRNDKYEIINSYFHKDTHFTLMGRNLVRFKGEKIAGALYFMDKLKELKPLYADIELYIERIMQCNMSIYPQLKNEINLINNELEELGKDLLKITPQWNKYQKKKKEYDNIKLEILEAVKKDPLYPTNYMISYNPQLGSALYKWDYEAEMRLKERHPEYKKFLEEYISIQKSYDNLQCEISKLELLRKELEHYRNTIYKHFVYAHRCDELIA